MHGRGVQSTMAGRATDRASDRGRMAGEFSPQWLAGPLTGGAWQAWMACDVNAKCDHGGGGWGFQCVGIDAPSTPPASNILCCVWASMHPASTSPISEAIHAFSSLFVSPPFIIQAGTSVGEPSQDIWTHRSITLTLITGHLDAPKPRMRWTCKSPS